MERKCEFIFFCCKLNYKFSRLSNHITSQNYKPCIPLPNPISGSIHPVLEIPKTYLTKTICIDQNIPRMSSKRTERWHICILQEMWGQVAVTPVLVVSHANCSWYEYHKRNLQKVHNLIY